MQRVEQLPLPFRERSLAPALTSKPSIEARFTLGWALAVHGALRHASFAAHEVRQVEV